MADAYSKYRCRCGETTIVPERRAERPAKIRTGCDECGTIETHRPVGSVFSWGNDA